MKTKADPTPAETGALVLPLSLRSNRILKKDRRYSCEEIRGEIRKQVDGLLEYTENASGVEPLSFMAFERGLAQPLFRLGRFLVLLFLVLAEERVVAATASLLDRDGRLLWKRPAQPRNLNTFFGVVRYWRTYMRGDDGRGFHPLDAALGLSVDRISMFLMSLAVRLATKMSFEQARGVLGLFVPSPPSVEVIEQTALGLGARADEWFTQAPPPEGDGEVLLLQFDGKAVPTATETELSRRRGKRRSNPHPSSRRHRGRVRRGRYGSKPRRKKGDKSKNGKVATLMVMSTLRQEGTALVGPINTRTWASFASKRYIFEVARREANKRGFRPGSGKLIQIVTDGDKDLARLIEEYFPEAIHTIDIVHVTEYIWKAGRCLYSEGSQALTDWAKTQQKRLYGGKIRVILRELKARQETLRSKAKTRRLTKIISYLQKRAHQMNYNELRRKDLELGSGAAEGGVKHILGARFDHGGMRWIRERAEALLQLRCIERNGDWDAFIQWAHDELHTATQRTGRGIRVQLNTAIPLNKSKKAA